jgi:hypothetical protein
MAAQTRVVAQPADGTVDMVTVNFNDGASKVTLEGFEFTSNHRVSFGGTTNDIRYVRNYCHDQNATCLVSTGATAVNRAWILANRIARIQYDGSFPNGYGIYGPRWNAVKINYNHCNGGSEGQTNLMSDCWEIDGARGFEMIGNLIEDDACSNCGITHSDSFMFWNRSSNGVIRDNVVVDGAQTTLSPDGSDVLVANNLVVRHLGTCLDVHPNGSSGDVQPLRYTFRNNTIWNCGFDALPMNGALAGRGGNIFEDNIIEDGNCTLSGILSAVGNVTSGDGMCGWPSITNHVSGWVPDWGATNTPEVPTYQPRNLPAGYGDAGYRPAPFGPNACPC